MAAHLHDSVLQTLALVQQRADDPRAVTALARRQERELRSWLTRRVDEGPLRLARALEVAASEVERDHGAVVDVVAVGDADLDARGEALAAAAREAMVNAAKFGAGSPVDVYAEAIDGELQVFVRDRGPGFDPTALPADRRGVRESIVGRMARHGGTGGVPLRAGRRDRGRARRCRGAPRDARCTRPARPHRRRPSALPLRRAQRARGAGRHRGRRADGRRRGAGDRGPAARRRPARRPHARRRRRRGDPPRRRGGRPAALPRAVGVRRRGGRHRGHPRRRARLRHEVDLGPGARRRRPARERRRRRVLPQARRLRARRLRRRPARAAGGGADHDAELDQLTPREREVLRHLARGYMYKEIALRLGISAKTVEAHVSAVLRKLQLSNRHELSRWAVERRLIE